MKRFKKPTPKEVSEYGLTLGFPIDGEEFCDFYESKGWLIGKSPMKDWQAAVRTWHRKWKQRNTLNLHRDKTNDYDQAVTGLTHDSDLSEVKGLFSDFQQRNPEK